jgi:hypothetical protein
VRFKALLGDPAQVIIALGFLGDDKRQALALKKSFICVHVQQARCETEQNFNLSPYSIIDCYNFADQGWNH